MTARFCLVKMTAGLFKSPGGHFFRFYCCQSQSNSQKQMHSGRDRIKNKIKKQKNKNHKGEMHMEKMFTAADFDTEVLGSDKPVLVDFFATWCGPCKMMAPAVEKLAEEYEGRAVIGKLDVEESMDIAGRYGVMNVPTLILFKDGRAVERKVGLQSASDLRKLLDSVL